MFKTNNSMGSIRACNDIKSFEKLSNQRSKDKINNNFSYS